jgi:hypothetical protein
VVVAEDAVLIDEREGVGAVGTDRRPEFGEGGGDPFGSARLRQRGDVRRQPKTSSANAAGSWTRCAAAPSIAEGYGAPRWWCVTEIASLVNRGAGSTARQRRPS